MNFRILITTICLLTCGLCFGQVTFQPKQDSDEAKGIVYNKEFTVDIRLLQTNGFSIGINRAKLKTYYLTPFYHLSIGELKHIKEFRQQSFESTGFNGIGNNQSYIFGKQNNLYVIRAGYGQKRYFSEKAKVKGLAVGMAWELGPTLGLLKPYYLDLGFRTSSGTNFTFRPEKFTEENRDAFLDPNRIGGSVGLGRGLGELSIRPGFHAQASAHFDWGAFDEFVKAVEAGFMVDVFLGNTDILVEIEGVENRPFFFNVFVNLQLGKRW